MTIPSLVDLCVPRPGSTTLRGVWSQALRRTLSDLRTVLQVHADGPSAADVREFWQAVAPLARQAPGALLAVLRRTEVGVWLRCLRPGASVSVSTAEGLAALLCTMALHLTRTGALTQPLRLQAWPDRIVDAGARIGLRVPPRTRALHFGAGQVVAETPDGRIWLPLEADDAAFVPIPGSMVRLALVDTNPLSSLEAHPEKSGNALDLGGQPVERWREALGDGLHTIARHLPAFREEIELLVQQVIPVGFDTEQHRSATITEAVGALYLGLHPNPMTMVEALVHETSHNKMSALFELDPVLDNPPEQTYASPLRPDPRPLRGVLLAVHAFLPVVALYDAMIEAQAPGSEHPAFVRRRDHIARGNHDGICVLRAHARPTAVGRQLLDEIQALDAR
ncbi:MAG: hypothetical protein K0V04_03825 [Deltaproteobacteria bacterium]|nr:hypothetical protein [Deltaproteobacteria bacterium]